MINLRNKLLSFLNNKFLKFNQFGMELEAGHLDNHGDIVHSRSDTAGQMSVFRRVLYTGQAYPLAHATTVKPAELKSNSAAKHRSRHF